jgi:hypothetical protein
VENINSYCSDDGDDANEKQLLAVGDDIDDDDDEDDDEEDGDYVEYGNLN